MMDIAEALRWMGDLEVGRTPRGLAWHAFRKITAVSQGSRRGLYTALGCQAETRHLKRHPDWQMSGVAMCAHCEMAVIRAATDFKYGGGQ